MRPFRAILVLALLLCGWVAWRWPVATQDYDTFRLAATGAPALPGTSRPAEVELADARSQQAQQAHSPELQRMRDKEARLQERLALLERLEFLESRVAELEARYRRDRARWQKLPASDAEPPQDHPANINLASLPPVKTEDAVLMRSAEENVGSSGPGSELAASEPPSLEQRAIAAASEGYKRLRSGDKRTAARRFDEALRTDPTNEHAASWRAQRALLVDRWSADAYVLVRDSDATGFDPSVTAAPVLGGGQSGGTLSYIFNPLAQRPLSAQLRASVAQSRALGVQSETAQAAIGLTWRPLPGVPLTVAAERLVKVGQGGRNDWAARVAGGSEGEFGGLRLSGPIAWSGYAEAGVIGTSSRDSYAAGQGRIGKLYRIGARSSLHAGLGGWTSVQKADDVAWRFDLGPSVRVRLSRPAAIELSADYRLRIAGDARPRSGPALTLSGHF